MRGTVDNGKHFGRRFVSEERPFAAELLEKIKMVRTRENKQRQQDHRAQVRQGGHTACQTRDDHRNHTNRHPNDKLENDVQNKRADPVSQEFVAEFVPGCHDANPFQVHDRDDKM